MKSLCFTKIQPFHIYIFLDLAQIFSHYPFRFITNLEKFGYIFWNKAVVERIREF